MMGFILAESEAIQAGTSSNRQLSSSTALDRQLRRCVKHSSSTQHAARRTRVLNRIDGLTCHSCATDNAVIRLFDCGMILCIYSMRLSAMQVARCASACRRRIVYIKPNVLEPKSCNNSFHTGAPVCSSILCPMSKSWICFLHWRACTRS